MRTTKFFSAVDGLIERASPTFSTKEEALLAVDRFASAIRHSPWQLDRAEVAQRTRELIKHPRLVYQGVLGLCGPAAFLRTWIWRDPLAFANFVSELYFDGEATLGTDYAVKPGPELVGQDYEGNVRDALNLEALNKGHHGSSYVCPPAEWMVMCSLTDQALLLSSYAGTKDDSWDAGSRWWDLKAWLEASGLYEEVTYHGVATDFDEVGTFMALKPGPLTYDVCLQMDSDLLKNVEDADLSEQIAMYLNETLGLSLQDHWACLSSQVTELDASGEWLQFLGWTWGRTTIYTVTRDAVAAYYHGVVIGKLKGD